MAKGAGSFTRIIEDDPVAVPGMGDLMRVIRDAEALAETLSVSLIIKDDRIMVRTVQVVDLDPRNWAD